MKNEFQDHIEPADLCLIDVLLDSLPSSRNKAILTTVLQDTFEAGMKRGAEIVASVGRTVEAES